MQGGETHRPTRAERFNEWLKGWGHLGVILTIATAIVMVGRWIGRIETIAEHTAKEVSTGFDSNKVEHAEINQRIVVIDKELDLVAARTAVSETKILRCEEDVRELWAAPPDKKKGSR